MIKAILNTKKYFQPPADYFWQWGDNGEVIEWRNGATICYRDDLITILKNVPAEGFPPIATLLLLLAACREEVIPQEKHFLALAMKIFGDDSLNSLLSNAMEFLRVISRLPDELKKGSRRSHLIHEVFEKTDFALYSVPLKDAIDELNSGRIDHVIIEPGEAITREQFTTDLTYLSKALERYPSPEVLELKLRTGLVKLPTIPEILPPDPVIPDLFGELEQDMSTLGIARLSRQLLSVFNIPMHSQGSGEHSYGGISDITNRGNYDRLLLSELANDDMSLMARLVNNEALYFRREEPPDTPKRNRTILIDVSLKMWGVPRVFALCAALAFAHNSKHGETIEAYALGGEEYNEVQLATKAGIIQLMELLHHSLHCGKALECVIRDLSVTEQNEYIFVTESRLLNSAEFHASLQAVRASLSFIITVNRNGELQFFECNKGITKLLSTAKMDLDELLFPPVNFPQTIITGNYRLPAFLSRVTAPLLYPKIRIKKASHKTFAVENFGLVAINENQIVLLLTDNVRGACEILNFIERGVYTFGWNGPGSLYILVNNYQRKFLKLYKINFYTFKADSINLSDEIQFVKEAVFKKDSLYLRTNYASFLFDCNSFTVTGKKDFNGYAHQFNTETKVDLLQNEALSQYMLGIHYTVMYKVKDIYVSDNVQLVIGNYHLDLSGHDHGARIRENTKTITGKAYSTETRNQMELVSNKKIKFSLRTWKDGSEALIDSRGLLHLKSSDKNLPEITIVLITGADTACWASVGEACGSSYFIDEKNSVRIFTREFNNKYIQPFISRLV